MTTAGIEAQQRTRAFARVLGPYLTVFTTIIAIRLPTLGEQVGDLFTQPTMVWLLGGLMLGGGLVIIGLHRNWRGPIAVIISLFGWFVALRGFALIAFPSTIESGTDNTLQSPAATLVFRLFFAALAVVGLTLTYAGWFARWTELSPRRRA
jgi:hypothetical protein